MTARRWYDQYIQASKAVVKPLAQNCLPHLRVAKMIMNKDRNNYVSPLNCGYVANCLFTCGLFSNQLLNPSQDSTSHRISCHPLAAGSVTIISQIAPQSSLESKILLVNTADSRTHAYILLPGMASFSFFCSLFAINIPDVSDISTSRAFSCSRCEEHYL